MNNYQKRLLNDIERALNSAKNMIERDCKEQDTEFMSRLSSIRTQCIQAALWSSELYGAMSQVYEKE